MFKPEDLPGHILYHKASHGHVDLEFTGQGEKVDELQKKYGQFFDNDMLIVRTQKSAVVRVCIEKLSFQDDFDSKRENISAALETVKRLYRWLKLRKQN